MGKKIQLGDIELKLRFDNLRITVEQVNCGVFSASFPRHRHSRDYYELHLVCGGKGILIADGEEYPLEKGVLCMTGPDVAHEQLTDKSSLMEEYCLGFNAKPVKNSSFSEASFALTETHFWIGKDSGECERLFEQLADESQLRKVGYQNNIKNIISSLFVELVRLYTGSAASGETSFGVPDDRRSITTDLVFLYEYASVTRAGLAKLLGLSERQLQRFLKDNYGKTFLQLRREARKSNALNLLDSGLSEAETAAAVGYEDIRSLNKLLSHD